MLIDFEVRSVEINNKSYGLSFKEKANILEESVKPNFDKEKNCKEYGIGETCLYKIFKEKDTILS